MNVLVLGAYGLIGREIAAELLANGHSVTGLGRDPRYGAALLPDARWIGADIASLLTPAAWQPHLDGIDAVVNASGALQSGPRDHLAHVQRDAVSALIVQISAPGADCNATTEFLRTKGEADDVVRASPLAWVILKPGLVISSTAYGGTALLRALAAVPIVQPIVLANSRIQTVAVSDVARVTRRCLTDPSLARQTFDLVEADAHTLRDIVLAVRGWLGFAPPWRIVEISPWAARIAAKLADIAGQLGWRSPMRTTALSVLADNVVGDSGPWRAASGETLRTLSQTLRALPATRQERSFARMELAFPLLVVSFAAFWMLSGLIGIVSFDAATSVVAPTLGAAGARFAVFVGAILDIAIGIGLLIRSTFRRACLAAISLSLTYLVFGTVLTPALWSDPLGPLLKILPVIGLAVALAAHAEER
jgi:uncharacterized protein YbjT (DUF2867 family)/uncharacterized membrane protein